MRRASTAESTPVTDPRTGLVVERLVADGVLNDIALARATSAARSAGTRVDKVLRPLGLVSDDAYFRALAEASGVPPFDETEVAHSSPIAAGSPLPVGFLEHNRCLAWANGVGETVLAVEDPFDDFVPAAVAARTGGTVTLRLLGPGAFERLFRAFKPERTGTGDDGDLQSVPDRIDVDDVARLRDLASDAPVIGAVEAILRIAVDAGASDIHLTADRIGNSRLRFRVDGVLAAREPPPRGMHAALVSRIKIMAGLDIAERRLPQDGKSRLDMAGRPVDLRVSTMPHLRGEGVVVRVLDRSVVRLDFDALGLGTSQTTAIVRALSHRDGLVLVTGPTGSGKSTTLYAALRHLSSETRNIVTIEDPVELELDGINQIEIARQAGLDFAGTLRAVLRQDPDVVMVGEIRDGETARVAVQAALTGHLVLATLHSTSAAGAIPRLIDMGVEPFLLASTVRGILAQRLVRRACPECRGREPSRTSGGAVCSNCGGGGYRGRLALAEFLEVSDAVADAIRAAAPDREIERAAGLVALVDDGRAKAAAGLTDFAEVRSVLGIPA